MEILTQLIKQDMKPALGVTEPGAIAFSTAKAKSYTNGDIVNVTVKMNSGLYKNAFTCGIPNSNEVGNAFAATLGVIAGNADKGLESLADITTQDNVKAKQLIGDNKINIKLHSISPDIFIETTVTTTQDVCVVTIKDSHINVVKIVLNDKTIFEQTELKVETESKINSKDIHNFTLKQIVDYVTVVDVDELMFMEQAYKINYELFEEGINSNRTTFAPLLLKENGNKVFSDNELETAQLLCNAAIEARVIGLNKAAMSITGSGAHGIIATMPLLAVAKIRNISDEKLLRATALSYLITMFIKEYSGKLSAFCGCAIAAGTGAACGLLYLNDGTVEQMTYVINNMASSITGMICDGGNQGCTMKGIVAVDAAFRSVKFALNKTYIFNVHGINADTPEETMKNMGLIASPGMVQTEKTIVEIFENK